MLGSFSGSWARCKGVGEKKTRVQSGCSQAALAWIRAASKTAVSFISCRMQCGGGGGQKNCMWGKAQQRLMCKSSKPQQPLGNRGEQKGEQDALLQAGALVGGRGPASYKGWVQSTKHPRSFSHRSSTKQYCFVGVGTSSRESIWEKVQLWKWEL